MKHTDCRKTSALLEITIEGKNEEVSKIARLARETVEDAVAKTDGMSIAELRVNTDYFYDWIDV